MKALQCGGCSSVVLEAEEACLALGRIFHTTCFICTSCGRTLKGMAYYRINGRIYCEEDYKSSGLQDEAIRCHTCDHVIKDSILEAQGNHYHPGCFKCQGCDVWLDKMPFTVGKDNKIYCIKDYHRLFSPVCWRCKEKILPVQRIYKNVNECECDFLGCDETVKVVSMEKDFHVDCFCCETCGVQLTDEPEKRCYPLQDHLLCHNCHLEWIKSGNTAPSLRTRNKSERRMSSELVLEQVKRSSGLFSDAAVNKLNIFSTAATATTKENTTDGNSLTASKSRAMDRKLFFENSKSSTNTSTEKGKENSIIKHNNTKPTFPLLSQTSQPITSGMTTNNTKATSPESSQRRRVRITDTVTYIDSTGNKNTTTTNNTTSLSRSNSSDKTSTSYHTSTLGRDKGDKQ